MNIDKIITGGWLVFAVGVLVAGYPFNYFLFGIVLAAIYNTIYEIKNEMNRVLAKEK